MVSLASRGIVMVLVSVMVNCEGKFAELLPVKKLQRIMDDSHSWQKNTSKLNRGNWEITANLNRRFKWLLVAIKCYDLEHRYPKWGQGISQGQWRGLWMLFKVILFGQRERMLSLIINFLSHYLVIWCGHWYNSIQFISNSHWGTHPLLFVPPGCKAARLSSAGSLRLCRRHVTCS